MLKKLSLLTLVGVLAIGTSVQAETGSVKGRFIVEDDLEALAPVLKKNAPGAKDAAVCAAESVPNEEYVIGDDGGLSNVFIYLKEAPDDMPEELAEPPQEQIVFDQVGCVFTPHAISAQAGQTILVKSSDGVAHNVRSAGFFNNTGFNYIVQANGEKEQVMDLGESTPAPIKCDIHPYMVGYWLITDHPYKAVSAADGTFEITGLPEGRHKFRVWHEYGGGFYIERSLKVEIEAGETTDLGDIPVELK